MTTPLHDYIAAQLANSVRDRAVVVWYDQRGEFRSFVDEWRGGHGGRPLCDLQLDGLDLCLVEFDGSHFGVRGAAEELVSGDEPRNLVIYMPGQYRQDESPLTELELAGSTWEPQLKRLARNALRQTYTDGVIDEYLNRDGVGYSELSALSAQKSESDRPSMLKTIFGSLATTNDGLLAFFIADNEHDAEIEQTGAAGELAALIRTRLGLDIASEESPAKTRTKLRRFVLGNEFRFDLIGDAPAELESLPAPQTTEQQQFVKVVAVRLRREFPDEYPDIAAAAERDLSLGSLSFDAGRLGAIDTFAFEESALLDYCGGLLADSKWEEAKNIVAQREHSFWIDQDVRRKAQWQVCEQVADVIRLCEEIEPQIGKAGGDAGKWVERYAGDGGWYRVDQAYRRMETSIATLEEDPEIDRAVILARRRYDDLLARLADGFGKAVAAGGWQVPKVLHQTEVFQKIVDQQPGLTAYFLVDAFRYEMGQELRERLRDEPEIVLRPAVAALPSITPIGMAALQPGAEKSFSAVQEKKKFAGMVDEVFLPDLNARKRHMTARVPGVVDITLDELLSLPPARVQSRIEAATLVVIRSQEIDMAGEGGLSFQARRAMDTVIDNLARAVRKLGRAGVKSFVISADHGHLFSMEREDAMKMDRPGGDEVDIHRRCWVGRGGKTPAGSIRVSGAQLGYDTDLDFIFPTGLAIFTCGGDPQFHHGGISLQEMIVPVLTLRWREAEQERAGVSLEILKAPAAVTNRIFSVELAMKQAQLGGGVDVKPALMAGGREVGNVGMVIDGQHDTTKGTVRIEGTKPVTVGLMLHDDSVEAVRIVLYDPGTDAVLVQSNEIPVKLGV